MENCEIIFIIIIIILIICIIISIPQQKSINNTCIEKFNTIKNNLPENYIPDAKIDQNICSKQCCKFAVWEPPFDVKNPNIDPTFMDKFIGTNLSCGNGPDNGGCVCMTKNDFNYIANRGQNYEKKYNNDIIK